MTRTRLTHQIYADSNKNKILEIPYKPLSYEWLPDELGTLIGRIFATEWELDHITYLLIDLVSSLVNNPSDHSWRDYLGYSGIILASAMAVNREWENEDIMWVYKDFSSDIGRWAMYTWDDFREMEFREFLADIICLVAFRRNDALHDSKLISLLLSEMCEHWEFDRSDILSYMVERRNRRNSFPYPLIDNIRNSVQDLTSPLGSSKWHQIPLSVMGQSLLWSPPEEYYIPQKWIEQRQKLHDQRLGENQQKQIADE